MSKYADLVQGTVDLLSWVVATLIRQASNEVFRLNQGALYPAVHRLEHAGWIASQWGESENNRTAKYSSLTPPGKKYLALKRATWERLSAAIGLVLRDAPARHALA